MTEQASNHSTDVTANIDAITEAARDLAKAQIENANSDQASSESAMKLTEGAFELMVQFGKYMNEVMHQHGPQAFDTILWVIRVDGMSTIVTGISLLVAAILILKVSITIHHPFNQVRDPKSLMGRWTMYWKDSEGVEILQILGYILFLFLTIPSMINLLSFQAWVSIFAPEITLYKKVFSSLLGV